MGDVAISVSGSSPQKAKSPLKAKTDEILEQHHSRFSTEDDQAQFAEFVKKSNASGQQGAGSAKRNRNVIVLPKSSRREVKVPLKYRDLEEDDEQTSSTPSKQPNLLSKPQKQGPKTNTSPATKKAAMKAVAALLQAEPEPELILPEQQEQVIMPFKAQELIDQHNLTFAVKSVASKTGQAQANALNEEINEKGEKIVECEQCGVKVVKRNLNRHILTVHEKVKTYSCPNCMMLFGAKQVMERHFNKVCKWSLEDIAVDNLDEIDADIELPTSPVSPEELQAAIIQETTMAVAVKSEIVPTKKVQQKSIEELSSLGVGTFSIDKDTARNMASGRFVKRIKIKRCGKCKECKSTNCQKCEPCRDMLKYGGPGKLKQACVYRRCANPTETFQTHKTDSATPVQSQFKSESPRVKITFPATITSSPSIKSVKTESTPIKIKTVYTAGPFNKASVTQSPPKKKKSNKYDEDPDSH